MSCLANLIMLRHYPEFCVSPTSIRMEQDYIRADEPEYGSPP